MSEAASPTALCQLCKQRPPDTKVYYDEVLASQTSVTRLTRRRSGYSTRTLSSYGDMMVCAPCAAQYENSVGLRKNARRLMNAGIILVILGAFLFVLLLSSVQGSLLELALAAPVLVGVVMVGAGFGLALTGGRLKQPVTRYLQARLKS